MPEPIARLAVFGLAPLLDGEDEADYNDLLGRVSAAVKPAGVIEELWVPDVVDYAWHVLRLRRVKALLINLAAQQGLFAVLQELIDYDSAKELAEAWARRNSRAVRKVARYLRMLTSAAEGRRDAMLREIARHRAIRLCLGRYQRNPLDQTAICSPRMVASARNIPYRSYVGGLWNRRDGHLVFVETGRGGEQKSVRRTNSSTKRS